MTVQLSVLWVCVCVVFLVPDKLIFGMSVLIREALLERLLLDIPDHFFFYPPCFDHYFFPFLSLCLSLLLCAFLPYFCSLLLSLDVSPCRFPMLVYYPVLNNCSLFIIRWEGKEWVSVSSPVGGSQDHKALFIVSLLFAPGLSANVLMLMWHSMHLQIN